LYGAFVWARWALNRPFRRFPARAAFQSEWTEVRFFQPGNEAFPVVSTVGIVAAPSTEHAKTFAVADYMAAFGIPSHGLNYTSGAPVNGTAAVLAALADAEKAGPRVDKIVLLPIGKLFIDGGLAIPPRTTLRGTARDKSTLYFLEDGIGTQLGGLSKAQGGSPAPDPAYIYGNHTSSWGIEDLSIYVTHFSNCVIWVAESSGFKLRRTLIRQLPYFCTGYQNILAGGGGGSKGGQPPAIGKRDKATMAALGGHASRITNWTVGANNIGAMIFLQGASNVEISDNDLTCTQWCLKSSTVPYFPLDSKNLPLPQATHGPKPHHISIVRNYVNNADVAFALGGTSQGIVEHNEITGSVLGGGAIYPSSTGKLWCSHNTASMHYSGNREAMTYDGNGGGAYFGPVASAEAGSTEVSLPAGAGGGGEVLMVINGTGFGQIHAVVSYDRETCTYTLDEPLVAALGKDAWVQTLAYQGKSHYIGNRWSDTGGFQLYGSAFDHVVAENVMRRMGGSMAWGQYFLNKTAVPPTVLQTSPDMRQLWLDNEVLDENGVRNYMASASHTPQKARITNSTEVKPAQQDP